MQANESGLLEIDAPIHVYVDPVLQRLNGTTLGQLWNEDPMIYNVTARQLMGEPPAVPIGQCLVVGLGAVGLSRVRADPRPPRGAFAGMQSGLQDYNECVSEVCPFLRPPARSSAAGWGPPAMPRHSRP